MAKAVAEVMTGCAHHWILGSPSGAVSLGVCKRCGAEREFSTAPERGWVSRGTAKKR
ncbi:MAG: hypothetical protein R3C39_12095 [Dehalococcoidia bacterium]